MGVVLAWSIQHKRGDLLTWLGVNPKLKAGQIGFEFDGTNFSKAKVGNGNDFWNDLPYIIGDNSAILAAIAQALVDAAAYTDQQIGAITPASIGADDAGAAAAAEVNAKSYADGLALGKIRPRGYWNGAGGLYPATGGSGTAGAILLGDAFEISTPCTIQGVDYDQGDIIIAWADTPGQTVGNWADSEHNTQQATESVRGTGMVGTQAEIENEATTDDQKYVTLKKFWKGIARFLGLYLDTDGTLNANSDTNIPSQKAVKTYADTKQAALGFTAENSANKDTDATLAANSDTKYASQKAVKTYVDLKANKTEVAILLAKGVNIGSVTGTTNESISTSILIPQNTFSAGNILRLFVRFKKGTIAGSTVKFYTNTINSLSGAVQIGGLSFSQASTLNSGSIIGGFSSATLFERHNLGNSIADDFGANGGVITSFAWNTAADSYLIISFTNASTTETTAIGVMTLQKF